MRKYVSYDRTRCARAAFHYQVAEHHLYHLAFCSDACFAAQVGMQSLGQID